MASDDPSGARPGPVVLRIKLRYDDVEAMIQRFAGNVGRSGLFLPTRQMHPVGTEVKFELRIATNAPVLVGLGRVKAARAIDDANPRAAFGLAIELLRVTREGRDLIMKMLERRRALGLTDVAIPMPDDVEAARRAEVDTQPRADVSADLREVAPVESHAPVLAGARPSAGPLAVAKGERRSGQLAAISPLAPEPARARRPQVAELIARASERSGATASVASAVALDDHAVDLERALVRARVLAGGEVDGELAALREQTAAPIEISVEAASAELARQLGGQPIARRDRSASARWAPPPPIEDVLTKRAEAPAAVAAPVVPASAEPGAPAAAVAPVAAVAAVPAVIAVVATEAEPAVVAPEAEPAVVAPAQTSSALDPLARAAPITAAAPVHAGTSELADLAATPAELDAAAELAQLEAALSGPLVNTKETLLEQSPHDSYIPLDVERLDERDLVDDDDDGGEYTQIGVAPEAEPIQRAHGDLTIDRLDEHLTAAEAEADAELDADSFVGERPVRGDDSFVGERTARGDDFDAEEISDLDVLAEADADDADLLSADGEADASGSHPPAPSHRDSQFDFASRLDLDDESVAGAPIVDPAHADALDLDEPSIDEFDDRHASGGFHELGGFDPPSSSYTVSQNLRAQSVDFGDRGFADELDVAVPTPLSNPPAPPPPSASPEPSTLRAPAHQVDLDSALDALDLDDLAMPRASSEPAPPTERRPGRKPRPPSETEYSVVSKRKPSAPPAQASPPPTIAPRPTRLPRAETEDGVLIDFDDDE